ncbi:MAG: Disulfide bond reductase DsbH precursor [Planctomycetota bacterium]|jgi:thioredoxin-related protein
MRILSALILAAAAAFAPVAAADDLWTEDFDAAKAAAAAGGKDLLIDFTGSDWCGWCIRLKEEVFDTPEFRAAATASFVLVEIDFPRRKPQDAAVKARNQALGQAFGVEGYPTIWLADGSGRPYAKTGYQEGGPEAYLAHLAELRQRREVRDQALAAAAAATGIEQARALDRALQALGDDLPLGPYAAEIDRIIALDADNGAGLKGRYAAQRTKGEVMALLEAGDIDKARPRIAALRDDAGAPAALRQEMAMVEATIRYRADDRAGAIEQLRLAITLDPSSEQSQMLGEVVTRLQEELAAESATAPSAP